MGKNLIVKSEVVGWDDIHAGILLDLPMCQTETLGLSKELLLGDLASPVVLGGLLQVTVDTHARETEDRSLYLSATGPQMSLEAWKKNVRLNHLCCVCDAGWEELVYETSRYCIKSSCVYGKKLICISLSTDQRIRSGFSFEEER